MAAGAVPARDAGEARFWTTTDDFAHREGLWPGSSEVGMLRFIIRTNSEGEMNEDERNQEALFRHSILGELLSRKLRRGQLRPVLKQLTQKTYEDQHGRSRRVAYKTLEEWYYKYRNGGFDALKPRPRKDRNRSRVLAEDLQQLVLDMKREDPGRSAHVILRELELAGRITAGQ